MDPIPVELDCFGQNPRLHGLYTQLAFCFRVPSDAHNQKAQIVDHLRLGLNGLSKALPWVGGTVAQDTAGLFKIHCKSTTPPRLDVQDLSHSLPSMQEFEAAGFPFSMLDENIIAPCKTLPDPSTSDGYAEVFLLRATFITGGLLLVINGMHSCMDMAGQCQVINLLAKACRSEKLSTEEVDVGNMCRRNLVALLDEEQEQQQAKASMSKQTKEANNAPSAAPAIESATWHYFNFSEANLTALKAAANTDVASGFVSTDDVLSAFIWQGITRARLPRLDPSTQSKFDRQVNARQHLGVPLTYPGNGPVHKVSTSYIIRDLVQAPLGSVASKLRSTLTNEDIAYKVRAEATALHRSVVTGKTKRTGAASSRGTVPSSDLKMSSWAKEKCYEFDFGGLLGKAKAVRRPSFEAWEGLCYFMPRTLDGEIAFAICLRDEDAQRLIADKEFIKMGAYIG